MLTLAWMLHELWQLWRWPSVVSAYSMECPKEQIDQIARFKDLTEEQKCMLLAANKEPGKYTEGLVMADKVQAFFRNIPSPLALALTMTEKHEIRERAKIMAEENCTELEVAFKIAEKMNGDKKHQILPCNRS